MAGRKAPACANARRGSFLLHPCRSAAQDPAMNDRPAPTAPVIPPAFFGERVT